MPSRNCSVPPASSVYVIEDEVFLAHDDVGVRRQLTQRIPVSDLNEVSLADALKRSGPRASYQSARFPRRERRPREKDLASSEVDDVPLETAVRLLADQAGLQAARIDNVLMVTTPEHAKQINADNAARKQSDGRLAAPVVPLPLRREMFQRLMINGGGVGRFRWWQVIGFNGGIAQ